MRRRSKRGIVGIEAAIILIAFVIVAAAVAFVALNMGMAASQKSKQAMAKGLAQASTALEVDGSVVGYSSTGDNITALAIPLRVAPGWNSVDLTHTNVTLTVRLPSSGESYTYVGILKGGVSNLSTSDLTSTLESPPSGATPPYALINATNEDGKLELLSAGEKAWLIIYLPNSAAPGPYGSITVEIKPPAGAPLTVTRFVPPTIYGTGTVDLG
jgi:flagellin FlaB